jgi:hypothetical protein
MATSDDKRTGASKAVSNRVTKFRLPERASRPSDDAYFDRVLSAVEHKDASPPAEAESAVSDAPETVSVSANNATTASSKSVPNPVPLRQVEAANSAGTDADARQAVAVPAPPTSSAPLSPQVTVLREDTARRDSSRTAASPSSLPHEAAPSFAEFKRRWSLFLTETHMNLCEEIFSHTAAVGRDNYDTTASKLCQAVNKSRRHTFLLLQQLEKRGFVTRKEIRDNNRLLGIRIWFHLIPLQQ